MSPPLVTWKFWIFFLLLFICHGYPFGLEVCSLEGRENFHFSFRFSREIYQICLFWRHFEAFDANLFQVPWELENHVGLHEGASQAVFKDDPIMIMFGFVRSLWIGKCVNVSFCRLFAERVVENWRFNVSSVFAAQLKNRFCSRPSYTVGRFTKLKWGGPVLALGAIFEQNLFSNISLYWTM